MLTSFRQSIYSLYSPYSSQVHINISKLKRENGSHNSLGDICIVYCLTKCLFCCLYRSQFCKQVEVKQLFKYCHTQLNSIQSWLGLIFLRNHKPKPLSSYTTKLDQIQYATLFQPNQKIHTKKMGRPPPQKKIKFKI